VGAASLWWRVRRARRDGTPLPTPVIIIRR
jgi:hypothetical protein